MSFEWFDVSHPRYKGTAFNNKVQSAIDEASVNGGIVYVPAGTWTVPFSSSGTGLEVKEGGKPITILGEGPGTTIIENAQLQDLLAIRRSYVRIANLTLRNSMAAGSLRGVVLGGTSPSSVLRNIELENVVVDSSQSWCLDVLGGTAGTDPISILCRYINCVFSGNRANGAVRIQPRCTTHSFIGCHITGFKGKGIWLDHCEGCSLIDQTIEYPVDNSDVYLFASGAKSCRVINGWFEDKVDDAGAVQWFAVLNDLCDGWLLQGCHFVRQNVVPQPRAILVGGTAAGTECRGVEIINPYIVSTHGPVTDLAHIAIQNANSEVAVSGGQIEYRPVGGGPTFGPIRILDGSNRSSLFGSMWRTRLPRIMTASDFSEVNSIKRKGDMIFREASGFEAWNGTTWIPMTVNRYASLNDVPSFDVGTIVWLNSDSSLRVYDGTGWKKFTVTVVAEETPPQVAVLEGSH